MAAGIRTCVRARDLREPRFVSYAILLAILSLVIVLSPLLAAAGLDWLTSYVLGPATLISATIAVTEARIARYIAVALLAISLLAEAVAWLRPVAPFFIAARVANTVLLLYVSGAILRHVVTRKRVTRDTILGAICVYMLLGVCFYHLFTIVELWDPGAFTLTGRLLAEADAQMRPAGRYPELVYYSFVTLTTLGYGDITPVHPLARSLATFEAVVGQLYLAVLVAALVGTLLAQAREESQGP